MYPGAYGLGLRFSLKRRVSSGLILSPEGRGSGTRTTSERSCHCMSQTSCCSLSVAVVSPRCCHNMALVSALASSVSGVLGLGGVQSAAAVSPPSLGQVWATCLADSTAVYNTVGVFLFGEGKTCFYLFTVKNVTLCILSHFADILQTCQ